MAWELPAPKDNTALLEAALQRRLQLLQQPTAIQQLAPQIAQATGNIAQGVTEGLHNKTVKNAHEFMSEYLGMDPETRAMIPGIEKQFYEAQLAAGITPQALKEEPLSYIKAKKGAETEGMLGAYADKNQSAAEPLTKEVNGTKFMQKTDDKGIKNWVPLQGSAFSGANPEAKEQLAQDLAGGKLVGKQFTELMGRFNAKDKSDIYLRARQINPNLNLKQADIGYAADVGGQTAKSKVQQGKGQEVGAVAGSMEDMLTQVKPLIDKISPSKFTVLNAAFQAGLKQVSDPEVNEALTYLTSAAGFYASLLKNGGTPNDVEMKAAQQRLSTILGKEGFAGVDKALRNEAKSRVRRLQGAGYDEPNPIAPQPKGADPLGLYK